MRRREDRRLLASSPHRLGINSDTRNKRPTSTHQEQTMESVRRWMSKPAIVTPTTTSLPQARRQMQEQRIRRLPVVDVAGRLVGIVTEGDINRVSDSPATDVRDYN